MMPGRQLEYVSMFVHGLFTTHHNIIGSFSSLPRTEAVEERDHDSKIFQGKALVIYIRGCERAKAQVK